MWHELIDAAALLFRFVLAFVFLTTAVPKLLAPDEFGRAVTNFAVVPSSLARPVARWLPRLELACAAALFAGVIPAVFGFAAGVLLLLFTCAVAVNLLRGRAIDCGCYGSTTPRRITWSLVARDAALAAMAFFVAARLPTALTLASWPAAGPSGPKTADGLAIFALAGAVVIADALFLETLRFRRASGAFGARAAAGV